MTACRGSKFGLLGLYSLELGDREPHKSFPFPNLVTLGQVLWTYVVFTLLIWALPAVFWHWRPHKPYLSLDLYPFHIWLLWVRWYEVVPCMKNLATMGPCLWAGSAKNDWSDVQSIQTLKIVSKLCLQSCTYACTHKQTTNQQQEHRHTPCRTLRSASANLLSVTRCNLSFGTRGFRTAAPTIWNSLLANVRSSTTLSTFRRHLKSHLFQSSFPTA